MQKEATEKELKIKKLVDEKIKTEKDLHLYDIFRKIGNELNLSYSQIERRYHKVNKSESKIIEAQIKEAQKLAEKVESVLNNLVPFAELDEKRWNELMNQIKKELSR